MFFLISFCSTLYADAPGPVNLSLKGIVDWVRFFQFVEYGNTLPITPSTRGVWFILWVDDEPALYWSNGSQWIPFVTAGVQAGSVDTNALADGAVTTPKIANTAVTEAKIANFAVTTNKIAENSVTGTKFANNSITTAKLAQYAVTNEKLGYLSVGTLNIQNNAVTSEKMEETLSNKNIVLNDGTVLNPSLSFKDNRYTGLSYDSASETLDISISASDKIRIGSSFINFNYMNEGLNLSSGTEKIKLSSNGIHYNDDFLNIMFDENINASGSILPYEDLKFDLGSSTARWNKLFIGDILSDNASSTNFQVNNIRIDDGSIYPLLTETGEIGTDTLKFKSGYFKSLNIDEENISNANIVSLNTVNASVSQNITATNITASETMKADNMIVASDTFVNRIVPLNNTSSIGDTVNRINSIYSSVLNSNFIYFGPDYLQNKIVLFGDTATIDGSTKDVIKLQNSIVPSTNNTYYLGIPDKRWKNIYAENIEVNGTASISKILLDSELISSGTVNVSNILINGEPLVSDVNMKFPSSLAVIDIEASRYSLKDNANLQNDYSQTWQYTSYGEDGDGLYMTYKNDVTIASSCYVTTFDTFDFSNATITLRLNASNLSLGTSNVNITPLLSIASGTASFISIVRDTDGKLNIKNIANTKVIDTDYSAYNWNETHDIFLIAETSTNNMYLYIDGDLIEGFILSGTSSMSNSYCQVVIGGQNPDSIDNSTLPDYNIRFRKIQIYNRNMMVKEMKSLPTIEAVAKLNRKNTTNPPCYTLGEPSTLIGGDFDSGEGFFGEVTGDKFIYGWEMLGQLWGMDMNVIDTKAKFIASFTEVFGSNISYTFTGDSYTALGVSDNLEVEWLKFYDNGYLIFIPKRPLLNNITWYEINNALANCAVGKEIKIDLRRINPLINSTYSNGNLISVRCRLMTGGNIQPFVYGNVNERGVKDNALGMGSEWNRLMYRICDQIPSDTFAGAMQGYSGGKQLGDNWFNFTSSDLGFGASNDLGRVTFTQEYCYYQNTASVLSRASVTGVGYVLYDPPSFRNTYRGFRPALVLEVLSQ